MALFKMSFAVVFLVILSCQWKSTHSSHTVDKCLAGKYHKKTPSKEGSNYVECLAWKNRSCCTADFTVELSKHRVENIYNFTWNHCANLSQACEEYIKDEECFWQCEPNLIKWHVGKGYIKGAPICSNYCNKWFDACKNDFTCATDWLSDFNFTANAYTCPVNSKCRTFSETYTNGEGLCNKMWGASFKYVEDSSKCMVMDFQGANPNTRVDPESSAYFLAPQPLALIAALLSFLYM